MRLQLILVVLTSLLLAACGDREQGQVFKAETAAPARQDQAAVEADIKELAKGKDPNDAKASAAYDLARLRLERRGATVEVAVIDALRTSEDWGVRLGCVEVLQSIGTRQSVDHLIAALQDDQPLVSFQAEQTLRILAEHREIPAAGQPTGANGLPSVPERASTDLAMDAEARLWAAWHAQHRDALFKAWSTWWATAKKDTIIK